MKNLVIGYSEPSKQATGFVIYAGNDGTLAEEALTTEETGVVRKVLVKHPVPFKTRHFPEQAGVERPGDGKLTVEVKVLDLPAVRAIIDLAAEKLAEANEKLVEAGMDPVEILFTEDLEEADEEDLKQLDALKALEVMARKVEKQSEDLNVLRDELAAANGELIAKQAEIAKLSDALEEARKAAPPAAGDSDGGTPPLQLEEVAGPPAAGDSDGGTPPLQLEGAPKEEGKPAKVPKNK